MKIDILNGMRLQADQNYDQMGFIFGKKAKERRQARRDRREEKRDIKLDKARAKADLIASGQSKGFLGDTLSAVTSIFGGGPAPMENELTILDRPTLPGEGEGEQTFFDKYKKPLTIAGVAALVGGGIYLATKKKKGRRRK